MNSRFESSTSPRTELQNEIDTWGPLLTSRYLQRCPLVTTCEPENPDHYEDIDLQPQLDLLYGNDGISCQDLEKLVLNLHHSSILDALNDRRIIPAIFRAIKRYTQNHSVRSISISFLSVN